MKDREKEYSVMTEKEEWNVIRTDIPVPRDTIYTRYIKRLLDVVLSGLGIICLSPLLLIICILELVYHGRPVLYVSKRPGKDGKLFDMYKFRSMTNETDENGELLPASNRLTAFGRFIRRTSMDELAGLFNIFKGNMSIIGPRALLPAYLPLYTERHKYRHAVRPGLACVPMNGSLRIDPENWTWNAQFESDIYYVEHCSFLLDLHMIPRIIKMAFSGSEMRTNASRMGYRGDNLTDTRYRDEIAEVEETRSKAGDITEKRY